MLNKVLKRFLLLMLSVGLCLSSFSYAQLPEEDEYKIKAAFLFNISKFVDWPSDTFSNESAPIVIGILGEDPFGDFLSFVEGKTIKGRRVVVKYFNISQDVMRCHVLFICQSEKNKVSNYFPELNVNGMLTIGDMERFAQNGGMINLIKLDDKIHFEINVDAAENSGLVISSKLLNLARIIKNPNTKREN